MEDLKFDIFKRIEHVQLPDKLIFGKIFTDNVFEMDYNKDCGGWYNPIIKKRTKIELEPATIVFHYGQAIFEGIKAYKQINGKVGIFRPEKHIERLNRSAKRMCIPEIDKEFVLKALCELVNIEKNWIPDRPGHSLYIRPVIFANEPALGVRASETYKFVIVLSPVGPYYQDEFKPVPILVTDKYVRAVKKGTGEAKAAGNYAAGLLAQKEAKEKGYEQILWLDGIEQKYIEEVGAMNIFIHFSNEIATPPLNGTIIPGITRMSVIELIKEWRHNCNERLITIEEIFIAHQNNTLEEIFCTGTAATILAVSTLNYNDKIISMKKTNNSNVGNKLLKELRGIQLGQLEDKYNWMTIIN